MNSNSPPPADDQAARRANSHARLTIVPTTRDEAFAFIERVHRHHPPPTGYLWAVAVANEAGEIVGVATIGRPSAHALQDGWTFEVTRSCTDGTSNANSALYGAAWRAGRALGYRRGLTYTQSDESGSSLRAAGWIPAAKLRPRGGFDTPSRRRDEPQYPTDVGRTRWEIRASSPPWPVRPRIRVSTPESATPSLFEEAS